MTYFADRRDAILAALDGDRTRPGGVRDRRAGARPARPPRAARDGPRGGEATPSGSARPIVIVGMPPRLGAAGVDDVAREIAEPLREAIG